jgi:hypothetical protein
MGRFCPEEEELHQSRKVQKSPEKSVGCYRTSSAIAGIFAIFRDKLMGHRQNGEQKINRSGGSRQNSGDKLKTLIRALAGKQNDNVMTL